MMAFALASLMAAFGAGIAEECLQFADDRPDDYDEDQQRDFLSNYFALGGNFSGIHGPVPHKGGFGTVGVRFNGLPPLPCRRRFALDWTKTEDTNVSPILPTLTASYAFINWNGLVPYIEAGFLPPVSVGGTRNLVFQVAGGVGYHLTEQMSVGLRLHAHVQRTAGEIATPIMEGDPVFDDLFLGSSLGAQLLWGYRIGSVTPYVMAGLLDASSIFVIGDTNEAQNNFHPYVGPELAMGLDGLFGMFRIGGEYYGAPGGSRNLRGGERLGFAAYGRLHTARLKLGVEI